MYQQLRNPVHYKELEYHPSSEHVALILEWRNKWPDRNQITEEIADWVIITKRSNLAKLLAP